MKPFTKQEILGISIILSFIFILSFLNFRISLRRARDAQRMADLGTIYDALNKYQQDFGFFPPSENGKIKACKATNFDEVIKLLSTLEQFDQEIYFSGLKACEWGIDSLKDLSDESYEPYLRTIMADPKKDKGINYLYFSNTKRYQIYAYLEGEESEDGYNLGIVARNLSCGEKICSFGKAFGETPLDMSIEEYENELLQEEMKKQGK
ncbi:hypothetical protein A2Z22_00225 [Candidatus Woesebacteria bacterium RBG_16_34_12]|uniref:Type II secretion system protein GspG C-terminal domain-containing protein n=1 Tax=Candidatus Woesebacteria bacterium RBG_16_34_12 TaxID=1802480 RepID=A0A1F7X8V3_9BACT|nr:MAG: hypothetical protein A2Z22_00225 [Candidatus Woesebacteria bacterium RBG_16_34_12]